MKWFGMGGMIAEPLCIRESFSTIFRRLASRERKKLFGSRDLGWQATGTLFWIGDS